MLVAAFSGCSAFLKLIGESKMSRGVHASTSGCLFMRGASRVQLCRSFEESWSSPEEPCDPGQEEACKDNGWIVNMTVFNMQAGCCCFFFD